MVEVRFPISGLSAEYGDIILSTVAADVTVGVSVGGVSILTEKYSPDSSGMVYVRDIGKLASDYFAEVALSNTAGLDGSKVVLAITLTEGATVISKSVSIYRSDVDSSATLTAEELLLKPLSRFTKKVTGIGRKEFLSFYSGGTVKVDACFTTSTQDQMTTHDLTVHASDNNFYRYDVSPDAIAAIAGVTVDQLIYYNVYKDASDILRFTMDVRPLIPTRTLFFRNSFGAQEVFSCLGDHLSERNWERERGSINRMQRQVKKNMVRTFTANTGYLNAQGLEALEDLLNSDMLSIFENDQLLPIVIMEESFKETSRVDDLVSVEFKYRLSTNYQLQYRHAPLAKSGTFDETFDQTFG